MQFFKMLQKLAGVIQYNTVCNMGFWNFLQALIRNLSIATFLLCNPGPRYLGSHSWDYFLSNIHDSYTKNRCLWTTLIVSFWKQWSAWVVLRRILVPLIKNRKIKSIKRLKILPNFPFVFWLLMERKVCSGAATVYLLIKQRYFIF